jgi:hypothetical protein
MLAIDHGQAQDRGAMLQVLLLDVELLVVVRKVRRVAIDVSRSTERAYSSSGTGSMLGIPRRAPDARRRPPR